MGRPTLTDRLRAEVAGRPTREVRSLEPCGCSHCYGCVERHERVIVAGSVRLTDITAGTRHAVRVIPAGQGVRDEELARPWLMGLIKEFSSRGRIGWHRDALAFLDLRAPRLWTGDTTAQELAYVDLVSAYPSIYSRLGFDLRWRPDAAPVRLGVGTIPALGAEEMPKTSHRVIGGAIRATTMQLWVRGRPEIRDTTAWSAVLAPDLWGVIMHTLHAVAAMAEDAGAIMWDTDGGILPASHAAPLVDAIAHRFGLKATVRDVGVGRVWGVKHWRIGDTETAQPRKRVLRVERNIAPPRDAAVRRLAQVLRP